MGKLSEASPGDREFAPGALLLKPRACYTRASCRLHLSASPITADRKAPRTASSVISGTTLPIGFISPQVVQRVLNGRWREHAVGDRGNLFSVTPRPFQFRELTTQR